MPVHHVAEEYLDAYLDAAGIRAEGKTPLFRTSRGRRLKLTENGLSEREALDLVKRRAAEAGLPETICNHTFRASGITAYLENGGTVENAESITACNARERRSCMIGGESELRRETPSDPIKRAFFS